MSYAKIRFVDYALSLSGETEGASASVSRCSSGLLEVKFVGGIVHDQASELEELPPENDRIAPAGPNEV